MKILKKLTGWWSLCTIDGDTSRDRRDMHKVKRLRKKAERSKLRILEEKERRNEH